MNTENNKQDQNLEGSKTVRYGREYDPGRVLTPKQVSRIQTRPLSQQKLLHTLPQVTCGPACRAFISRQGVSEASN